MLIELVTTRPTARSTHRRRPIPATAQDGDPGQASAKVRSVSLDSQDPQKVRDRFRAFVKSGCHRMQRRVRQFGLAARSSFRSTSGLNKARAVLGESGARRRASAPVLDPIVADFKTSGMIRCWSASRSTTPVHSPNEIIRPDMLHRASGLGRILRRWRRVKA